MSDVSEFIAALPQGIAKSLAGSLVDIAECCDWAVTIERAEEVPQWLQHCEDWGDKADPNSRVKAIVFRKGGTCFILDEEGMHGDYYDGYRIDQDFFEQMCFSLFRGGFVQYPYVRFEAIKINHELKSIEGEEVMVVLNGNVVAKVHSSVLPSLTNWEYVSQALLQDRPELINQFHSIF